MKKRVLSALLALCMACTLAGNVWAAEETEPTPAPSAGVEAQTVEPQTVEPTPSAEPTQAPAPSPDATAEPEATPEPSAAPSAAPDATVEPDATPAPTEEPEATAAPAATATPDATAEPTATPAPTEVPAATEAPAPSEAPSATPAPTAEAEGEPVADGVEYTAALEQDGQALNVIVTAPEGAFDAGVTPALSVTAIEDEAEGDAIAAKLDESGVTYDGFAALDISFKNEAGEEIEPKLPVTVRIELPEAIVDSGIDLNTLAVQHLAEDEAGNVTSVDPVASVADGTITLSEEARVVMEQAAAEANAANGIAPMMLAPTANSALTPDNADAGAPVVAEFTVDGFSTFTITWTGRYGEGIDTTLDVTLVTIDNGQAVELNSSSVRPNVNEDEAFSISDDAPYIQNYTYERAVLASNIGEVTTNSKSVTSLRLEYDSDYVGMWPFGHYEYSNFRWEYRNGYNWTEFNAAQHIYLIYSKDETGGTGGGGGDIDVDLPEPAISKTAILNPDDETYSLNLSVTGGVGSQTSTTNVDVLLVVDESNSMTDSRIRNTKTAIKSLIDSLESQERVDARYSIYTFGDDARDEMSGWRSMPDTYDPDPDAGFNDWQFRNTTVGGAVNGIDNSGEGTNYEAALAAAATQIASARDDAITVVVFLSDGKPSMSLNWGDGYSVMSSNGFWAWRETLQTADNIYCDQFYSIGISADMEDFMGDSNEGYGGLINAVNAQTKVYQDTDSEGTDLSKIFEGIGGGVTNLYIENITIHDALDLENVEQVPGSAITVSVTDRSGDPVSLDNVDLTDEMIQVSYSDEAGLTFSIPNYDLKPGYTYTVTMQIQPTDDAKKEYADQQYPDTPSQGVYTGTHTNDEGLYSNTEATLTYYYTDNEEEMGEQTMEYPMPVVQVPEAETGDLTITKVVEGIDDADAAIYQNTTFTFTVEKLIRNVDGTYTVDTAFTDTTLGFAAGKKTVTITGASSSDIEGLLVGWYRVTETNHGMLTGDNDYEYVHNDGPVVVEVKANSDSSAQALITNTYQHKAKTLTVIKTITGNMAYDQDTFQFTLALQKDGEPYELTGELPNGVTKVEGADGQYTFSLKAAAGSNQMEFTLTHGVTATVTETLTEEYEETSRQYKTGSEELPAFGNDNTEEAVMNDNMTFEFQNKKEIVTPPTGLDRNDTPYALMITAAGIAGLALIGAVVNRRLRRRREW